jgi:hypothetical protein
MLYKFITLLFVLQGHYEAKKGNNKEAQTLLECVTITYRLTNKLLLEITVEEEMFIMKKTYFQQNLRDQIELIVPCL